MQNIFVYGTLKRGQLRAATLADQEFLGQAVTAAEYWMFDLGSYPGLVDADPNLGASVSGEVYRVDARCRRELDEIECVDEGLYELREVRLDAGAGVASIDGPVCAYFYLGSIEGCRRMDCWP